MLKTDNERLASNQLLEKALGRADYVDAFQIVVPEKAPHQIDDLVRSVFHSAPQWVMWLLRLRNTIVRPFGLKTTFDEDLYSSVGELGPGSHVAFFEVYHRTDEQVLMGQDDRHLNFRVVVELSQEAGERVLKVTTAVHFNNWLGRLYFVPVRPFHKLIVPAMMGHGLRGYGTQPGD
jgi:hypothetical protein